jgi:hypothetical protein
MPIHLSNIPTKFHACFGWFDHFNINLLKKKQLKITIHTII